MEDLRFLATMLTVALVAFLTGRYKIITRADLDILNPHTWSIRVRKLAVVIGSSAFMAVALFYLSGYVNMATIEITGGAPLINPDAHPVTQVIVNFPVAAAVILGTLPILEEWLFRHVLMRRMMRFGLLAALLSSSAVFAFFHLMNSGTHLGALIPVFVGGMMFGIAYHWRGFACACMTHILYNELVLIAVYL